MITESFFNTYFLSVILKPAEVIMNRVQWVKVAHTVKKKKEKKSTNK